MENRILRKHTVEMSVVCSDLSLLENINSLLRQKGVISVEDDYGILHYIVDGRNNRKEVAGKVTSIRPPVESDPKQEKEDAYLDLCIRTVLREYGFDMSLIGSMLVYRALYDSYKSGIPLAPTMKSMYYETGRDFGLSYQQSERDVRYAITRSSLKNMRSRAAMRCIQSRVERRLSAADPIE
ncbi:MAG: hypothetical protein K5875_10240 [Saccharofermentans sp.]|nr:hypothetical protein [Saccharofermentans sp.]